MMCGRFVTHNTSTVTLQTQIKRKKKKEEKRKKQKEMIRESICTCGSEIRCPHNINNNLEKVSEELEKVLFFPLFFFLLSFSLH